MHKVLAFMDHLSGTFGSLYSLHGNIAMSRRVGNRGRKTSEKRQMYRGAKKIGPWPKYLELLP